MLDDTQQQSLVTRLNRIEGQIRGIRRMVQEPRVCVDILQQLAAAEAALNRISLAIMRFVQGAGILTVAGIGLAVLLLRRRERPDPLAGGASA